jgi:alpha-L-fucosidase
VDVVSKSKNGNFLLDIGPAANGIIPQIMQKGLKVGGRWIKEREESIYGTRFWQTTNGKGNFRYPISDSAFYIHVLNAPSADGSCLVPDKTPFLKGDSIVVLGGKSSGTVVLATRNTNGSVALSLDSTTVKADRYVWTFKVINGS